MLVLYNQIDVLIQESINMATEWEKKKAQLERTQKQRLLLVDKKARGGASSGDLTLLDALSLTCNELVKEIRSLDLALGQKTREIEKLTYQ